MVNKEIKVCLLSSMHSLYDDRINWKESLSLKKFGYTVYHIGIGEEKEDYTSMQGNNMCIFTEVCLNFF